MVTLDCDTISTLHECCLYQAPVLILNPSLDQIYYARFESVSKKSFTLCLLEETHRSLNTQCYVITFSYKGNCCAFFATVLDYQENANQLPAYLTFQLPSRIIGLERRSSWRVAIGEKVVPLVRLSTVDGRVLHPKPKDLSLTGIMIEFDEIEDPDLQPASELWLELGLDDHEVLLKSVIKRRDGPRYFLFFPEAATSDGIHAPLPLRKIIDALDRAQMQEKLHQDENALKTCADL